jgi:hypothetical protein
MTNGEREFIGLEILRRRAAYAARTQVLSQIGSGASNKEAGERIVLTNRRVGPIQNSQGVDFQPSRQTPQVCTRSIDAMARTGH